MSKTRELSIKSIKVKPVDLNLTDCFTISQGSIETAENIFLEITLESGVKGYGEITPFEDLFGKGRDFCTMVANDLKEHLIGKPVSNFIYLSRFLKEISQGQPAVRCGYEIAIIDAYSRSLGVPFWGLLGGRKINGLKTDITIPMLEFDRSVKLSGKMKGGRWSGFLKICLTNKKERMLTV